MATWTNRRMVPRPVSNRPVLAVEGRPVLDQESFQAMIALERKRSERSHRAYALVLVTLFGKSHGSKNLLEKIANILPTFTRDTDLAGWHKPGSSVGVIFTDISGREKNSVIPNIVARVVEALRKELSVEEFARISIAVNCYPEDWRLDRLGRPSNPELYPDLKWRDRSRKVSIVAKRLMDIAGSLIALILLSPVIGAAAIAIKLTSRGPVFFRQRRVGQHGKPFVMLKFRSMYTGSDAAVHQQWFHSFYNGKAKRHRAEGSRDGSYKLPHDPRVTPLGRLLRRSSLDEVPQFLNVLRGEMSLVGPRPLILEEDDHVREWARTRLNLKPGITGMWQVLGASDIPFDEMTRLDYIYVTNWSLWGDIRLIVSTFPALARSRRTF